MQLVLANRVGESMSTESTLELRVPYTDGRGVTKSVVLDPLVLEPGQVRNVSLEVGAKTQSLPIEEIVYACLEAAYSTPAGTVLVSALCPLKL